MSPLNTELFLAFELSEDFSQELSKINPHLYQTFVAEGSEYLQPVAFDGKSYIGKWLGSYLDISQLELIVPNVLSILSRLVPEGTYTEESLALLALPRTEN